MTTITPKVSNLEGPCILFRYNGTFVFDEDVESLDSEFRFGIELPEEEGTYIAFTSLGAKMIVVGEEGVAVLALDSSNPAHGETWTVFGAPNELSLVFDTDIEYPDYDEEGEFSDYVSLVSEDDFEVSLEGFSIDDDTLTLEYDSYDSIGENWVGGLMAGTYTLTISAGALIGTEGQQLVNDIVITFTIEIMGVG